MFRDPCKKCIVEVVCSQECEGHLQYKNRREILTCGISRVSDICFWYSMWFLVMVVSIGMIIN